MGHIYFSLIRTQVLYYIASGECLLELGKYLPIKVAAGLHNILGKGWRVGVGVYNIKHQ